MPDFEPYSAKLKQKKWLTVFPSRPFAEKRFDSRLSFQISPVSFQRNDLSKLIRNMHNFVNYLISATRKRLRIPIISNTPDRLLVRFWFLDRSRLWLWLRGRLDELRAGDCRRAGDLEGKVFDHFIVYKDVDTVFAGRPFGFWLAEKIYAVFAVFGRAGRDNAFRPLRPAH